MNYTSDPQFLIMIFILPGLFGFTLVGEGIGKVVNYDPRGWISVTVGNCFLIIIILAYLMLNSNLI